MRKLFEVTKSPEAYIVSQTTKQQSLSRSAHRKLYKPRYVTQNPSRAPQPCGLLTTSAEPSPNPVGDSGSLASARSVRDH